MTYLLILMGWRSMDGLTTVTLERIYIIYNLLKLEEQAFEYASKMVLWWLSYKKSPSIAPDQQCFSDGYRALHQNRIKALSNVRWLLGLSLKISTFHGYPSYRNIKSDLTVSLNGIVARGYQPTPKIKPNLQNQPLTSSSKGKP